MSTLVVLCHPVPESFVAAVAARAVDSLDAAGAGPRLVDLYAEGFSPTGADPSLVATHQEALRAASALVLVYPTWWSGLPAMLAGWFEQVVAGGAPPQGAKSDAAAATRERLANLGHVAVVTTHGSSKLVNAAQGEAGMHFLKRSVRPLCPPGCRFRWLPFYSSDRSTENDRGAYLDRVDSHLRRLARANASRRSHERRGFSNRAARA